MVNKIREYIKKHNIIRAGDSLVIGVSGGADSVVLFDILYNLKEVLGVKLYVVHVHHGIRGADADSDARFVEELCKTRDISCEVYYEDVKAFARENGYSEEEAGRIIRRQRLQEAVGKYAEIESENGLFRDARNDKVGNGLLRDARNDKVRNGLPRADCNDKSNFKIVLAHHMNDNAETLILNLCRGTGITGIAGMKPINDIWIRPLLCVTRDEIESYARVNHLSFCEDKTNASDDYTRNKIRHHILPYMETEINAKSVEHMTAFMEKMDTLNEFIHSEVKREFAKCVKMDCSDVLEVTEQKIDCDDTLKMTEREVDCGDIETMSDRLLAEYTQLEISKDKFDRVHKGLRPYILSFAIERIAGKKKDITSIHIRDLEELFDRQVGKFIHLPYEIVARRTYEGVRLEKLGDISNKKKRQSISDNNSEIVNVASSNVCDMGETYLKYKMNVRKITCDEEIRQKIKAGIFPRTDYTKWFDYDIIQGNVCLRSPKPNESIELGKNGTHTIRKKLNRYFIDAKVDRQERADVLVVADTEDILWIVGHRQSTKYQVSIHTKVILEIEISKMSDIK
jgi:tRNA(Ile)-lysidine synthase